MVYYGDPLKSGTWVLTHSAYIYVYQMVNVHDHLNHMTLSSFVLNVYIVMFNETLILMQYHSSALASVTWVPEETPMEQSGHQGWNNSCQV